MKSFAAAAMQPVSAPDDLIRVAAFQSPNGRMTGAMFALAEGSSSAINPSISGTATGGYVIGFVRSSEWSRIGGGPNLVPADRKIKTYWEKDVSSPRFVFTENRPGLCHRAFKDENMKIRHQGELHAGLYLCNSGPVKISEGEVLVDCNGENGYAVPAAPEVAYAMDLAPKVN